MYFKLVVSYSSFILLCSLSLLVPLVLVLNIFGITVLST